MISIYVITIKIIITRKVASCVAPENCGVYNQKLSTGSGIDCMAFVFTLD